MVQCRCCEDQCTDPQSNRHLECLNFIDDVDALMIQGRYIMNPLVLMDSWVQVIMSLDDRGFPDT
jgi:hypothetical protein